MKRSELNSLVKTVRSELNTERTQITSADYSLGSRFGTLVYYLDNK
nr:MAG TPA: hypothetical protein [Caudoviricetes sp.]